MLELSNVSCGHDKRNHVLRNVSFKLEAGNIACIFGANGIGKTTLLYAIAGFLPVLGGEIRYADQVLASSTTLVPAVKRKFGFVFQENALFPHCTCRDNILFGLRKWSNADKQQRLQKMIQLLRLEKLENRYPHQLSGGQQQRTAIARALAPKPKLLLLDEPFSNLDHYLRRVLSFELRAILKEEKCTALVVTHEKAEAINIGDILGLLTIDGMQRWENKLNATDFLLMDALVRDSK